MRIIQILFFVLITQSYICSAGEIYPYEPTLISLQGILNDEQKFGPPNYGESPEIDKKIDIYTLSLSNPITVGTKESLSELNDSIVKDIQIVQVVFLDKSLQKSLSRGVPIILSGHLSKQISGNDFYPIIFRVIKTSD